MKKMMFFALILIFIMAIAPVAAQEATEEPAPDITGNYTVVGTDPAPAGEVGLTYEATLTISERDDAYDLVWMVGENAYEGLGILTGNILSVAYNNTPQSDCAVSVFTLEEDGSLLGTWAEVWRDLAEVTNATPEPNAIEPGKLGTDILTPEAEDEELVGSYQSVGTNPDGSEYTATATIEENGDLYQVTWEFGEDFPAIVGAGILQEDVLTVGWGIGECGVMVYTLDEAGVLTGIWSGTGIDISGNEVATPAE